MANKVDAAVYKRILELRAQGLTFMVIGQRLGLSERTARLYAKAAENGETPFTTTTDTLQH